MFSKSFSAASLLGVLCLSLGLLVSSAHADIVGTESLLDERATADVRAELSQALDRADVVEKLQAFGIGQEQAAQRVAAMTQREAQQLAQQFEALPAGGDITLLLVVIIIILLIR